MTDYLSYRFEDNEHFINTFDELPLWSAAFGLLLLQHLELRPGLRVIDIGSGSGFPLLELASRLGNSCSLYGIDPWTNGNKRAAEKIASYGLINVKLMTASAENIPFEANSIDLIISNLGINNLDNPEKVFAECNRVLKPGGLLALTSNLQGHWKAFYAIFYSTLSRIGKAAYITALKEEEEHRGTTESITRLFSESGFTLFRQFEDSFTMRFLDGTAFLNHHFVKFGWLSAWTGLFPEIELREIFTALEKDLNSYATAHQGLTLEVPMLYMEGKK